MVMITIDTPGNSRLIAATTVTAVLTTVDEAAANALIDEASAIIATYTRRVLYSEQVTQTLRSVCTSKLALARWPISSLDAITEDGTALMADDFETDTTFVYRLSNDSRVHWWASKLVVQFTAGYATIPADIQRACLDLCINLHAQKGRDTSIRSINVPDVEAISYRDMANGGGLVSDHVGRLLDPYRRIVL